VRQGVAAAGQAAAGQAAAGQAAETMGDNKQSGKQ